MKQRSEKFLTVLEWALQFKPICCESDFHKQNKPPMNLEEDFFSFSPKNYIQSDN